MPLKASAKKINQNNNYVGSQQGVSENRNWELVNQLEQQGRQVVSTTAQTPTAIKRVAQESAQRQREAQKEAQRTTETGRLVTDWARQIAKYNQSGVRNDATVSALANQGKQLESYLEKYGSTLNKDALNSMRILIDNGKKGLQYANQNVEKQAKANSMAKNLNTLEKVTNVIGRLSGAVTGNPLAGAADAVRNSIAPQVSENANHIAEFERMKNSSTEDISKYLEGLRAGAYNPRFTNEEHEELMDIVGARNFKSNLPTFYLDTAKDETIAKDWLNDYTTEDERRTYEYIKSTKGDSSAKDYLDKIRYNAITRAGEAFAEDARKMAVNGVIPAELQEKYGKLGEGLATIATQLGTNVADVITNFGSLVTPLLDEIQYLAAGKKMASQDLADLRTFIKGIQQGNASYVTSGSRNNVEEMLANIAWQGASSGIENVMSMYGAGKIADAVGVTGATQFGIGNNPAMTQSASSVAREELLKNLITVPMGSGAMVDGIQKARSEGYSNEEALARGFMEGAIETVTEEIGMDWMFNIAHMPHATETVGEAVKSWLKSSLASGTAEGMEEIVGNAANRVTNAIIDAIKGKPWDTISRGIAEYQAQGMSQAEAMRQYIMDNVKEDVESFASAFFSAGMMSPGIAEVVNNPVRSNLMEEVREGVKSGDTSYIQGLIETGLSADPNSRAYKNAVKLQQKIDSGKSVSAMDAQRQLARNIEYENRSADQGTAPYQYEPENTNASLKEPSNLRELVQRQTVESNMSNLKKTFGTEGQKVFDNAIHEAMQNGASLSQAYREVTNVYNAGSGRNDSYLTFSLSKDTQQTLYKAGIADRETFAKSDSETFKPVRNANAGIQQNETLTKARNEGRISAETENRLNSFGREFGVRITLKDYNERVNGENNLDKSDVVLYMNSNLLNAENYDGVIDADAQLMAAAGHEFAHTMKVLAPESYDALVQTVVNSISPETFSRQVSEYVAFVNEQGGQMTQVEAQDEIVNNFIGREIFAKDSAFVDSLIEDVRTDGNMSVSQKKSVLQKIKEFFGKLRSWLRGSGYSKREIADADAKYKEVEDRITALLKEGRTALKSAPVVESGQGAERYSLKPVAPVEPTSEDWKRGTSYTEIKEQFPGLWDTESDDSDSKNPTSVKITEKSYRKYFDYLKGKNFSGRILDASSGLGYGTEVGRNEYNFNIEDIEPYPQPGGHQPSLGTDYSAVDEKFDFIISNAVLNVIPQDQRDALVVKMGEMLNPGGEMVINVRTPADIMAAKSKVAIPNDTTAWYISSTGSYQKGFTYNELKGYLLDALGDDYTVEKTKFGGGVTVLVKKAGASDIATEAIERMDISLDSETESVFPADGTRLSQKTWNESDYVTQRNEAAKDMAKALGVTQKEAKDYIDTVNGVAKYIADNATRLDYVNSNYGSAFVSNSEYGGSFDFTTMCQKARLFMGTFTEVQKALGKNALSANEVLELRKLMKDKNYQVTCGCCYVEGSRASEGQFALKFMELYQAYFPDNWQPDNLAQLDTPDGIEWTRINHPECYEQYMKFWNDHGRLREGDPNLFASQQKPKMYQSRTAYNGEILNNFKTENSIEQKNLNGGIRMQSFSDFEIVHLIDSMQVIMDMSRVGLAGQAYTKVYDFADAFGDTGLKINLSLIAKGVDENGDIMIDPVEGMTKEDAIKLRDKYSDNVGTIIVCFNDEEVLAAMKSDFIDFIIPFHRSQWKKSQYQLLGLPEKVKDYTYQQNEKLIRQTYHEYRGRMVKDKATNYMPNMYWDFSMSGKENAEKYLRLCAENNKRPKFYKFLTKNADGSYSLKKDGSTDGYWKLLIDFKMYNNEGVGVPQKAVRPDFSMKEINAMLENYTGGHNAFPVAHDVVDKFTEQYKKAHNIRNSVKYTPEEMDAHRQTLMDDMRENYDAEYTDDYAEAGYIFPNGKMLKMGAYGQRGDDHARASIAYDDISYETYDSPKAEAQNRFINEGNIRYMPENGWLNFGTEIELTPEQYNWVENAVYDVGITMIEFTDLNGKTVDSKEYTGEEEANVVINDIKRFYRDGKIGGSRYAQFRYSVKDTEYLELAENPDTNREQLQRMVDEAAREAGYDVKAYHGTSWGGFTVFNTDRTSKGKTFGDGVYLTSSPTVAEGFSYPNARDYARAKNGEAMNRTVYDSFIKVGDNALEYDWDNFTYNGRAIKSPTAKVNMIKADVQSNPQSDVIIHNIADGSEEKSTVYVIKDSNRIKSADLVTYDDNGNVIPLSERFNAENPDIRYSQKTNDTTNFRTEVEKEAERQQIISELKSEVKSLQEQNDRLKAQFKRTVRPSIDEKDLAKRIRSTIKLYDSREDSKGITEALTKAANEFYKDPEANYTDLQAAAIEAAGSIVKNAIVQREYNEPVEIKRYLRDVPIEVTQKVKEDFGSEWNNIRKAYFGTLRLGSSGRNIEELYSELSNEYRNLFPADIQNPSDQLEQIMSVVDSAQAIYENPYDGQTAEAIESVSYELISNILDVKHTAKTYADRQADKFEKMRKEMQKTNQERVKRIREEKNRRYEDLKQHYRDMADARRIRKSESEDRQRLLKLVQRLDRMKTTQANRAVINDLIGEIDSVAVSITKNKIGELNNLREWYNNAMETDEDFVRDPNIEAKIDRLNKIQIKDMNIQDVRDLIDVLKNVENEIRTAKHLIDSEDRRDTYLLAQEVIEDINRSTGVEDGLFGALDRYIIQGTLSPERALHRMTGYNDNDPLYKATKKLSEGQRTMLDFQYRANQRFLKFTEDAQLMKDITGSKAKTKNYNFKDINGKTTSLEITPAMRISLYLHSQNPQNLKHIVEGGLTIPGMEQYKKGNMSSAYDKHGTTVRLTPSQIRQITGDMTAKEKALANAVDAYFNDMSQKEINEVSEKLKGYSLAQVESYFPINTDSNFLRKDYGAIQNDGTVQGMGFLQERVNATNPVLLRDVTDVLNQSIEQTSKYVGLAIPVSNMNKLLKAQSGTWNQDTNKWELETSVQKALSEKWDTKGKEYISKMMSDVQNPANSMGDLDKAFSKVRSFYAGAVLTWNLSVAMKQAASYPTAAAIVGWGPLAKAMTQFGSVDIDLIAKYTPLQWYRSQGFSTQELGDIKSQNNIMSKLTSKKALNWIQGIDLLTTRKLWKAAEIYIQDTTDLYRKGAGAKGQSDAYYRAVADIYNQIIEETQPNYTTMQRPELLRSNSAFTQAVTMFKTQPFQNFNVTFDAIANFGAKRKAYLNDSTAENLKAYNTAKKKLSWMITSQLAQLFTFASMTLLWNLFRGKLSKYKDDDEEVTAPSLTTGLLKDMASSLFGEIPFGTQAWELIAKKAFGDTYYGFDNISVSALNDTVSAFSSLSDDIDKFANGENDLNSFRLNLDKEFKTISKGVGLPYENIENLFNAGFLQVARGVSKAMNGTTIDGDLVYLQLTTDPAKTTGKSQYYDLLYRARETSDEEFQKIYDYMINNENFGSDSNPAQTLVNKRMRSWYKDQVVDAYQNDKAEYERLAEELTAHPELFEDVSNDAEYYLNSWTRDMRKQKELEANGLTNDIIDQYEDLKVKYENNDGHKQDEVYKALMDLALSKSQREYIWNTKEGYSTTLEDYAAKQKKAAEKNSSATTNSTTSNKTSLTAAKTETKTQTKEPETPKNEGYISVSSSIVNGFEYDYATQNLTVYLKTGTYNYTVSPEVYEGFKNADSKGSYFNNYVKR